MNRLGYYAKDKNDNLFQFEWGENDGSQNEDFYIIHSNGEKTLSDVKQFEILEIGFFVT